MATCKSERPRGDLYVSRDAFIAEHVVVCQARAVKKYDNKKPREAYHSLDYSRRKCAKSLWRKAANSAMARRVYAKIVHAQGQTR